MNGIRKTSPKVCFLSIDIEFDLRKNEDLKGVDNLERILTIFRKYNLPATLFIIGNIFEKYFEKIKEWSESYEIACHSFSHRFWNKLNNKERNEELEKFIEIYKKTFNRNPRGFRAPSHIIDAEAFKLLAEKYFLYDSSIIPHYPFFKKYRGYKGKFPTLPYWQNERILEIPVSGLIFGIPLTGSWISKLPLFVYKFLFLLFKPTFLTFNLHSWDSLNSKLILKIEEIFKILKDKNYQFLNGEKIYELFSPK